MALEFGRYLQSDPQQNQYLQGDPSVDNNAMTSWMEKYDPSTRTENTGFSGLGLNASNTGTTSQPSQPTTTPQTGTALGAISSGTFGTAPLGFDQAKWNDPTQGTSNKYIAGRLAQELYSQGMSPAEVTRRVAERMGATAISDDAIRYPDGFIADLFFDADNASGQRRVQYTDVTGAGQGNGFGSFVNQGQLAGGQGNINWQQFMNNLMQQIFSAQQGQRRFIKPGMGRINPSGGFISGNGNSSAPIASYNRNMEFNIPTFGPTDMNKLEDPTMRSYLI